MRELLYAAFFVSGLSGLVYETIWSRYLGLFVGHGSYAQVVVLVVFLGGLSVGSLLVAHLSRRVRRPLLWYAGVEAAIGIFGLFFHELYVEVTTLARGSIFPALSGSALLTPVKWTLASALILPPSVLLGTTFPFMSAGVLRLHPQEPGRTLSVLYFVNSLGAAAGALLAGFFLVAWVGLPGTMLTAASLNLLVALAVWAGWRGLGEERTVASTPYASAGADPAAGSERRTVPELDDRLWRLFLAVAFGTAVASFIYEIAWIRMLSLVLGAATHSFELMLSAFILGLALGAFWMRGRADELEDPVETLGAIQWAMGLAALATLPVYLLSFDLTAELMATLQRNAEGYRAFTLARYGLALAVMLPSTFFAGTTLPLITRTLLVTDRGERAIGWVYGINTLGSIIGVAVASLVLLPVLGLKNLLILGAGLDMLLGVALLARLGLGDRVGRGKETWLALGGTVAAVALVLFGVHLDRRLLNSGVYRYGAIRQAGEIVYYQDGRTATVAVERTEDGGFSIFTNGKADASLSRRWMDWFTLLGEREEEPGSPDVPGFVRGPLQFDEPTQSLLGMITMAHRPDARTAAVVGQGSGVTSHFLLGSPELEEAVTVEIEPAMVEGSRALYPANRRVFDDPRSTLVIDDAKSYFASSQRSFDVVISEPSNPWVSGVASLFTVEFYETVRRHLEPGGVFGQWLQLYEIDDRLVLTVLGALHQVFDSYELFVVQDRDILVVASAEPRLPEPDWTVFDWPRIRMDFGLTHSFTPPLLEATRFLDRRALAPLLDGWERSNSDFYPLLDLGAERARYLNARATGFLEMGRAGFDPQEVFLRPRSELLSATRIPIPQVPRARSLLRTSLLRQAWPGEAGGGPDAGSAMSVERMSEGLAADLYRIRRFEEVLRSDAPPASWSRWTEDARTVVELLHGGVDGVPYDPLFDTMTDYVDRWDAPAGARAATVLLRGTVARDWDRVAGAVPLLLEEARRGRQWVPPELLVDVGVPALLLRGDSARARTLLTEMAPDISRPSGDVRSRLLRAWVDQGRIEPGLWGESE